MISAVRVSAEFGDAVVAAQLGRPWWTPATPVDLSRFGSLLTSPCRSAAEEITGTNRPRGRETVHRALAHLSKGGLAELFP
jgi:hypothetical protein